MSGDGPPLVLVHGAGPRAVGAESPAWAVRSVDAHAEALPNAEQHALEGQGHSANMTAPGLLAAELERFLVPG